MVVLAPGPAIWRHVVLQYQATDGSASFYLDGKLVFDSSVGGNYLGGVTLQTPRPITEIFGDAEVYLHWPSEHHVIGKFAQMRMYPRRLSAEEIEDLMGAAAWPSGDPIKQCVDAETDFTFYDKNELDASGLSCGFSLLFAGAQYFPRTCMRVFTRGGTPDVHTLADGHADG